MGTSRQFSREFKLEAVKLEKERGVSVAQAARDSMCLRTCCASECARLRSIRGRHFPVRA